VVTSWCTWCREEFDVGPDQEVPVDPDEPRFCSYDCEEQQTLAEFAYNEGRYGNAPVY
jgi:hypothetical protein